MNFRDVKIKYIAKLNPSKSELNLRELKGQPVSFLPMDKIIGPNKLDLSLNKLIEDVYSGYTYFKENDIVLAKVTPCFENGNLAVARGLTNKIGFGTTELHVLRVNDKKFDTEYIYYCLQLDNFKSEAVANMYGVGGLKRIPTEFLREYKFFIPDLKTQKKISKYLTTKLEEVSKLIESKLKMIELLQQQRQSIITEAVTKGLNPNVKMKDSGVEWIGEIPEYWDATKIVYYSKLLTGGTPNKDNPLYWENGDINWMTSGEVNKEYVYEVNSKITQLGMKNSAAKLLPPKSIVMALNGQGKTKGKVAVLEIETTCNQSLAAFVCNEEKLHYLYLYYYLKSKYKELRGLVGDGLRDGISLGLLKSIKTPFPPMHEQIKIARYLSEYDKEVSKLILKEEESIELLKEYRQSLIYEAVTGKIDVRDMELDD